MNRTSRLESDNLAISCGFQEMPAWSIDPLSPELLRKDSVTLGTAWQTMNFSVQDGLSPVGNMTSISGS